MICCLSVTQHVCYATIQVHIKKQQHIPMEQLIPLKEEPVLGDVTSGRVKGVSSKRPDQSAFPPSSVCFIVTHNPGSAIYKISPVAGSVSVRGWTPVGSGACFVCVFLYHTHRHIPLCALHSASYSSLYYIASISRGFSSHSRGECASLTLEFLRFDRYSSKKQVDSQSRLGKVYNIRIVLKVKRTTMCLVAAAVNSSLLAHAKN